MVVISDSKRSVRFNLEVAWQNIMIYNTIKSQIKSCKNCPLSSELDYGLVPQWGVGNHNARLLAINLRSNNESHLIEKPIELKYSLLFKKILSEVAVEEKDVFVTNYIKCQCPLTPAKKFKENAATCSEWISKELETLTNIKCIIGFGIKTLELMLLKHGAIINSVSPYSYLDKPTYGTYSFEEIFRKGSQYYEETKNTLEKCKVIINA